MGRPSQLFAATSTEGLYWEGRVAQADNRLRSKCGVALVDTHLPSKPWQTAVGLEYDGRGDDEGDSVKLKVAVKTQGMYCARERILIGCATNVHQ